MESGETTGVLNENEDGGIVIYKNGKEIAKIPYPEKFTKVEKEKIEEGKIKIKVYEIVFYYYNIIIFISFM